MSSIQYIKFHEVFNFNSSQAFIEAFRAIEASDQAIIPIQIKSPGGAVWSLSEILDVVDSSNKPVATYTTAIAASCGSALAMSGTDGLRFIGKNARFMVHQAAGGVKGKASDVRSASDLLSSMTEQLVYDRCDKSCKKDGFTKNLIKENFNADLFITADKAIGYGYFDDYGTIDELSRSGINSLLERI